MGRFFENLFGTFLLYISLIKAKAWQKEQALWPTKQWILGHRGARMLAPENTLSSFRLAMMHGADGVEFDVIVSKDGVPVVIHDDFVDRTTNGHGAVRDMTAHELSLLDATKTIFSFKREGIPTLKETLALFADGAIINIELKSSGRFSNREFVDIVLPIIKAHEDRLCLIVSSFDGELLAILRSAHKKLRLALLLSHRDEHWPSSLKYIHDIAPDALHLHESMAGPIIRLLAQRASIPLAIWTVNNERAAKSWFQKNIAYIFTDRVPEIVKALRG